MTAGETKRPDYAAIAAQSYMFTPRERIRLVEPMIAFLEGLNVLRDDQEVHLVTLYELHDALTRLASLSEQHEQPRLSGVA